MENGDDHLLWISGKVVETVGAGILGGALGASLTRSPSEINADLFAVAVIISTLLVIAGALLMKQYEPNNSGSSTEDN